MENQKEIEEMLKKIGTTGSDHKDIERLVSEFELYLQRDAEAMIKELRVIFDKQIARLEHTGRILSIIVLGLAAANNIGSVEKLFTKKSS